MPDSAVFTHGTVTLSDIVKLDRGQLVAVCGKICASAIAKVGENGYCGGIRPGNFSFSDEGRIELGTAPGAGKDSWTKEELEYISPELFWEGKESSAADVYAIGLILFVGVNGGHLPFIASSDRDPDADERASALTRRLNGEAFRMPWGCGRKLAVIIKKALAFNVDDRYRNLSELLDALAEFASMERVAAGETAFKAFGKTIEELSPIEAFMVEIISKSILEDDILEEVEPEAMQTDEVKAQEETEELTEKIIPEAAEVEETLDFSEEAANELPAEDDGEETVELPAEAEASAQEEMQEEELEILPEVQAPEATIVAVEMEPEQKAKPEKQADPRLNYTPAVRYNTSEPVQNEAQKKAKSKRPYVIVVAVCVLICAAALIFDHFYEKGPKIEAKEPVESVEPTAAPSESLEPEPSESVEPVVPETTYQAAELGSYSWTEAKALCEEMGGQLVCINDAVEFAKVCELADAAGAKYVWIGCHNVDRVQEWLDGNDASHFINWKSSEPSYEYKGTPEDCIMLEKQADGSWVAIDVPDSVAADYPQFYAGKIVFVCEINGAAAPAAEQPVDANTAPDPNV